MSESIRQSNLFAAEDYQKVFKAFQFIDYTAYDFDTLKQALINYIQTYYPEDFNDYIESSEFIAIIELLAYLGTSLAFRTELNSRENFIDTAERRESIIRLAQMVNYVPRRNIAASGLFKIAAVQTDQPLIDANGININDLTVFWNDPNNPDWFDQFTQICNAAFNSINPFGRPTKSGFIGGIPTDLYQLNNVLRLNVTYPTNITISGQQYPVDVCNPDFITNQTIFERDPDPANAFNLVYRNDSLGVGSANTGFFLYFKQGSLINIDTNFEFPVPNRLYPIDIQNINQDDVYVQETDQNGNVINKWLKVPALAGENIIYNSIQFGERNIFDVISGADDTISIRFADGNFGNVPTGLFRTWIRTSANQALVIRPDNVQGQQINIPYIGVDQQQYTLRIVFNLETTIGNAAPSETDEQIKLRAPEVFSTQSRMVNGSDYNVLPLVYGNQISKIQALDRTYSGQSRYLDLNDPTGFHRDLIIFGEDGALFRDNQNVLEEVVRDSGNSGNIETILVNTIQDMLRDPNISKFFYDEYLAQFESTIRVNADSFSPNGYSLLTLSNPSTTPLFWKTSPSKFRNDTGYFVNTKDVFAEAVPLENTFTTDNIPSGTYQSWGFITTGSVLQFANSSYQGSRWVPDPNTLDSAAVSSVIQSGLPLITNPATNYAAVGPIELGKEEQNFYQAVKVYPKFRTDLTTTEIANIVLAIDNGISFWMYYDLITDTWGISTTTLSGLTDLSDTPFIYPQPIESAPGVYEIYSDWAANPQAGLIYVNIASNNQTSTTSYDLTGRGRVYVFSSYRDVRFYWEPGQIVIDNASGQALRDSIQIMPYVNTNNTIDNNDPNIIDPTDAFLRTPVDFYITGTFVQNDGYLDSSKVEVSLVDADQDSIPDDPDGFTKIITAGDRVVFEYYTNEITGYQNTRPWVTRWSTVFEFLPTYLFLYFPVDANASTVLYGSPYLANQQLTDPAEILDPSTVTTPGFNFQYLDEATLIVINNSVQLDLDTYTTSASIANQITAFFNGPTGADLTAYPWLDGTQLVQNKSDILETYFFSKSFLLSSSSPPGFGQYRTLRFESTSNLGNYPTGMVVISENDTAHFDKNGKAFTQNLSIPSFEQIPMYFKWSHYSPIDQRVDPAASNIIDMIVITDSYYRDVVIWKNSNGSLMTLPQPPTTEDLRIQFQDLDKYKMVSDSMVWNSGQFKLLFGTQALPELQATFKVVKAPSSNMSDNEVKTRVVQAIDTYFDIRNWDFGEKFYYTELAAFIHQQLSRVISSVVIVPNNASSQFGNLFEIIARPYELFMSTATVNNVQIVSNLTDQNLRV
jgi:hypothetical protein